MTPKSDIGNIEPTIPQFRANWKACRSFVRDLVKHILPPHGKDRVSERGGDTVATMFSSSRPRVH